MDIERRLELICRPPTEEVITKDDLRQLLETKSKVTAYDGFEPSGVMHLGTGLMRAIKLQDMLDAKVDFKLWVADWFAWINGKYGGDLEKIQAAGKYFLEGWKACGVDTKKVKVLWVSDVVNDPEYWKGVIKIAKMTTVQRAIRAGTIMGRKEGEMLYTAQLFYPMMQTFDPFYIEADILQLGMDQRKATVLTRELAQKVDGSTRVSVLHHLLLGLQGPGRMGAAHAPGRSPEEERDAELEQKMSKSKPETCVFIHDSPEEISRKISSAYCTPKEVLGNPILEICKYIIFRRQKTLEIERPAKFGGNISFASYEELEKFFGEGKLHPSDLKPAVANALAEMLAPVRRHFERNKKASELLAQVRSFEVTR
jgi:tyrosyl-tRNA synthetase